MIDPYQRWNDEMFPETKILFPLFEEMRMVLNLQYLSPFPTNRQFMRLRRERTNQLITDLKLGIPLFPDTGISENKFVVGYGFQDLYAFIGEDPKAYLIIIQPCEFDIMSNDIQMTPYEYRLLRSFTEFLGLREPDEMHKYRCDIYTKVNAQLDEKMHRSITNAVYRA